MMTHPTDVRARDQATSAGSSRRAEQVRCPQCFSRRSSPTEAFFDDGNSSPWRIVTCADCNLMYTNPRPALDDWRCDYPDDYFAYQVRKKRSRWHSGFRIRWRRWLLRLYRQSEVTQFTWRRKLAFALSPVLSHCLDPYLYLPRGEGLLLDVGCGSGQYLARMKELGWEVLGIDINPLAAERARRQFGISVITGSFPNEELPQGKFDLVTAWQVLEHLDRPRQALACMRRSLRHGGRLVLTVPNPAGWAAGYFGPKWVGLDLPRHLVHFTFESLAKMLRSEGFEVLSHTTLGQSGWIRHSIRRQGDQASKVDRYLLGSRAVSRALSALAVQKRLGETIHVVAEAAR